jgi:hypothetical protein
MIGFIIDLRRAEEPWASQKQGRRDEEEGSVVKFRRKIRSAEILSATIERLSAENYRATPAGRY